MKQNKKKPMFEKYYHLLSKSPIGPVPCLIPETDILFAHLPSVATHPRVLDVGSGQGTYSERLRHKGYIVYSLDMDNSQYPQTIVGDMHEIPWKDNQFNIIFCTGTLEHAFAPYVVLSEFCRVLKDGGYIMLSLPMEYNIKMLQLPEHFCSISLLEMKFMYCTKLNMEIKHWEKGEWDTVVGPHQIFVMEVYKDKK